MRTLLIMGECRLLLFLAIGQVLQNLWHFEILTWESMGKPKMWIISKTAYRRVKWPKFGSRGTTVNMYSDIWKVLWCLIPWVWFGAILCTMQNFQFYNFLTLLLSQFSSNFIPKLYTRYPNHYVFGDVSNIKNIWWHFNFFLNTGPYGDGNFKMLYLPQFSLKPIQTLWKHWLPCLLEYRNEKLASST